MAPSGTPWPAFSWVRLPARSVVAAACVPLLASACTLLQARCCIKMLLASLTGLHPAGLLNGLCVLALGAGTGAWSMQAF